MIFSARCTRSVRAAAAAAAFAVLPLGCSGGETDTAEPADVRAAAEAHVREAGGEMAFDDPSGEGRLALAFDHVHEGVKATEGGRQVVCVDFESADGTVYDVDFYVDRAEGSGELVVEDTVVHKVGEENVLPDARRAELDRRS